MPPNWTFSNSGAPLMPEIVKLAGRELNLSKNRKVFVGRVAGDTALYIRFWNDGLSTSFTLSEEAFAAMLALRDDQALGHPREFNLRPKSDDHEWRVAEEVTP
jgi:hypothetical protein